MPKRKTHMPMEVDVLAPNDMAIVFRSNDMHRVPATEFTGMQGPQGDPGPTGATGATGPAGPTTVGTPNVRSMSLGNAYQATDTSKPAVVTINLVSLASQALLSVAQASQVGEVIIGSTSAAVTGATGTKIGVYENTQGGVLVVGLTLTQRVGSTVVFPLPAGWYFGVRQTTGANLSITSAFDQSLG